MRKVQLRMREEEKYQIIKKVAEGKIPKARAEIKLSITRRQVDRLVVNYKEGGKESFIHKNRGKRPAHAIPPEMKALVVQLYQKKYAGANFSHFTELLKEHEEIELSRTAVATILDEADILSPKAHRLTQRRYKEKMRRKNKQVVKAELEEKKVDKQLKLEESHPSRPRKKYFGELVQIDASDHLWFGKEKSHLHVAIDDATGAIIGAYFDRQETLNGYYHVYHQILTNYGIPFELFSDRRTVFEYERKHTKQIEKDTFTQFGYACQQLGTKISTSSVPQAKGRVERLFETLQSRLITELRIHNITTMQEANAFLNSYIKKYNEKFALDINHTTSVMETAPVPAKLNIILGVLSTRKINAGQHFAYNKKNYLPVTAGGKGIYFQRGTEVLVIQAFDGELYVSIEDRLYRVRQLASHELKSAEFDISDQPKKETRKYIPPMSHPWKAASFNRYLAKRGITQEEYDREHHA